VGRLHGNRDLRALSVLDRRTQPEGRVMVSFRQPEIKSLAVAGSDPILEELVRTAGRCGARGAGK